MTRKPFFSLTSLNLMTVDCARSGAPETSARHTSSTAVRMRAGMTTPSEVRIEGEPGGPHRAIVGGLELIDKRSCPGVRPCRIAEVDHGVAVVGMHAGVGAH